MRMPVFVVLFTIITAAPAAAQSVVSPPPQPSVVNLSGPRFGVTTLSDGVVQKLADRYITVNPVISQFGWQFEKQFYSKDSGVAMLNEWVFLLGGLDQGVALPSLSWLVGLRTANGTEFGVGPNVTPVGISLAMAAGTTIRAGFLNVPVNVAVVPSKSGMRVSFLTGFSLRK
ncbi:MAG TPA: hypothetical protein VJ691_09135 [Vicinamibacterales bacterium]|nr:hypothetical protein [Vicinamibacterales bacterium]